MNANHPLIPATSLERAKQLRRRMTVPERLLWSRLRNRRCAGYRFRRQHPFGPYTLDFYCHELLLAIEIDGRPMRDANSTTTSVMPT